MEITYASNYQKHPMILKQDSMKTNGTKMDDMQSMLAE